MVLWYNVLDVTTLNAYARGAQHQSWRATVLQTSAPKKRRSNTSEQANQGLRVTEKLEAGEFISRLKQNSAVLWLSRTDVGHPWPTLTPQHPDNMAGVTNAWRLFIKELVKELVMPHMKRCLEAPPAKPYYRGNVKMCYKQQNTATTWKHVSDRRVSQRGRGAGSAQLVFPVSGLCARSTNL